MFVFPRGGEKKKKKKKIRGLGKKKKMLATTTRIANAEHRSVWRNGDDRSTRQGENIVRGEQRHATLTARDQLASLPNRALSSTQSPTTRKKSPTVWQ